MIDELPEKRWPAKRIAALVLTVWLAGMGVYGWRVGMGWEMLNTILTGVVLGTLYTVRGGTLPDWVRARVYADDDPRNMPPKIYLPVLGLVLLAVVIVYWFYGPKGHWLSWRDL